MENNRVIIIGAGISGINMGIQLKRQLGHTNYTIYEKGDTLGETWTFNTYPGAGCDVPSHFYSFSFDPNPNWSHPFSGQEEILDYVMSVAKKNDVPSHVKLNTECISAKWDELRKMWDIVVRDSTNGQERTETCKVFISAVGVLGIPNPFPYANREDFKGELWHTAQWRHDVDLTGKNVVVIGNGCSASQMVPAIAGKVKHLTQIVRGQQYVIERPNPPYGEWFKWMSRNIPLFSRIYRFYIYYVIDLSFNIFYLDKEAVRKAYQDEVITYMKKTAPEQYHDILLPKYAIGQKRRVFDTDYLDCLHRDNVELTNERVVKCVANGVEMASGRIVPADVIIYANGFNTQDFLVPMTITGDDGKTLKDRWKEQGGAKAYRGTAIPNCPNMSMLIGPNTVTGHFSVIYTSECMTNYAIKCLRPILAPGSSGSKTGQVIRVKQEAEDEYNRWIQKELKRMVWADPKEGETGWYIDKKTGHNPTIYPHYQTHFWWSTLFPKWRDFEVSRT